MLERVGYKSNGLPTVRAKGSKQSSSAPCFCKNMMYGNWRAPDSVDKGVQFRTWVSLATYRWDDSWKWAM